MPRALSEAQRMLVETLLEAKMGQAKIANRARCSIRQIKKMAKNKRGFGTVVKSKTVKQGRSRTFMQEMIEVRSNSVICKQDLKVLNFADLRDFLHISLRTLGRTWMS
jgi:hypothetical protein